MKKNSLLVTFLFLTLSFQTFAQNKPDPWTPGQLLAPRELAGIINSNAKDKPVILCIGPMSSIPGSTDVGPVSEKENLKKLRSLLTEIPKDKEIVIYCGCCPFEHCPNIRPAFTLLKELNYKHIKLLNLSHNLKIDWIDKGYPIEN